MTVTPLRLKHRFNSPEELSEALGIPFSDQQLTAITAPLEPGVIIAGAGSGKTTVMAARVVWLVGSGAVRPDQVLGLTFTRKAAAELSARVRAALLRAGVLDLDGIDEAGEQVVMTYDAYAARLVAEHGLRIGVDSEQTMITGATRFRLASRVVAAAAGPFEAISRLQPQFVADRVLKLDAELQAHLVGRAELDRHARRYRTDWDQAPLARGGRRYKDVERAEAVLAERLELASLVGDYQGLKRRLGVVEFADQMATAAHLVRAAPEVAELVRDQFKVVLLDEYQDTSAAQAMVLQGLFSGPDADHGRGHPVTAVGDPFQAIYGWRGAAASNILNFSNEFPRADGGPAPDFTLTVNRRSGQTILDVANVLAAPLRSDPLLADGPVDLTGTRLVAPASSGPGEVRAATFETWPEEVAWIGEQVAAAHQTGAVDQWSEIAILTRRNGDIGPLYTELTSRDIPVEIVGLGGLLGLPEVRDVVATLRVLDDVTANPALIRLLSGPRWSIGPRDLALLGSRARELAGDREDGDDGEESITADLQDAVADVDPTSVISLLDALENPGEGPYSEAARERFAAFAAELAGLRAHADEPVLDLTRRVIGTLGLEVELVATPQFAVTERRNQLAVFTDAVADYVDVDGDASLSGLLAYLLAEEQQGNGLDQATPSEADSIKLLTVHKAKGLEWRQVYLPALVEGVFPSTQVFDNWVKNAAALPADLRGDREWIPQLEEVSNDGLKAFSESLKKQQLHSEDRLGYVAVTRAKQVLVGTGHVWRPENSKPRKRSGYLQAIIDEATRQDRVLAEAPPLAPDAANPLDRSAEPTPWPRPLDEDAQGRRRDAARAVQAARARFAETGEHEPVDTAPALLDEAETIAGWDADADQLLAEARAARRGRREVTLPSAVSATNLLTAVDDPEAYAEALLRPMPRPPSRSARFGTRFHAWIEQHYALRGAPTPLVDPDELPDRADTGAADELALRELCERFAGGRFGERVPYALEAPFTLLLDGLLIRGRIDAVYRSEDPRYDWQIVDWKTGRAEATDPGQLALYRRAWAELHQIPVERVDAVFYFVRTDQLVRPDDLPDVSAMLDALA
ncbi:ATP-dependent DNA helicase [Enemella evansiae]|uniref:DNA 3'-5' helicase n=1 Tax=Enemella evansiae TaxID=2016499 RepID=A0A255GFV2_9ACTN|nr:ATP-dependent DNA helicase [Enemella evansiae]OYO07548.1 ATP-dependent DNA helicase [Enemella evansiae]OYO14451.1 ATP-dependent DNA helicase [Enemella evansiae]